MVIGFAVTHTRMRLGFYIEELYESICEHFRAANYVTSRKAAFLFFAKIDLIKPVWDQHAPAVRDAFLVRSVQCDLPLINMIVIFKKVLR